MYTVHRVPIQYIRHMDTGLGTVRAQFVEWFHGNIRMVHRHCENIMGMVRGYKCRGHDLRRYSIVIGTVWGLYADASAREGEKQ